MPEPAAKSGKLPKWAWILAAGIGLLLAFFLLRRSKDQPAPTQPVDQPPTGEDQLASLAQLLEQMINGAHGQGLDSGDGTGGATGDSGCLPHGHPCQPAGPLAESPCCTGNCSFYSRKCRCHTADYECRRKYEPRNQPPSPSPTPTTVG